jgi:cytochrome c-type biogenesis protein CcmH/NrfF
MRRIGLLAALGLGLAVALAAAPSVDSVAAQLRPPDCPTVTSAADCPSQLAAEWRARIAAELARGESPQQVVDGFVRDYGPAALALPPRRGLGALAWWLPPLAVAAGGAVAAAWLVAARRAGRGGAAPPTPGPGEAELPPELRRYI